MLESLEEGEALVPAVLWELEAANALLTALKRGRFKPEELDEQLAFLDALPLRKVSPPIENARVLAREHQLTSYDGAYLALALGEGCRLRHSKMG